MNLLKRAKEKLMPDCTAEKSDATEAKRHPRGDEIKIKLRQNIFGGWTYSVNFGNLVLGYASWYDCYMVALDQAMKTMHAESKGERQFTITSKYYDGVVNVSDEVQPICNKCHVAHTYPIL